MQLPQNLVSFFLKRHGKCRTLIFLSESEIALCAINFRKFLVAQVNESASIIIFNICLSSCKGLEFRMSIANTYTNKIFQKNLSSQNFFLTHHSHNYPHLRGVTNTPKA